MPSHSEVRGRQQPLRTLYREQPAEAMSAKWARTRSANVKIGDPFHGEVEVGDGYGVTFRYGLDRKIGGLHDLPNPGDMLCAVLASCLDSTIRMIADLLSVKLASLSVEVGGEVDLRGTLMIDAGVPVGFRDMAYEIHADPAPGTDPELVAKLIELSEQCCITLQTLRQGVPVETKTTTRSLAP